MGLFSMFSLANFYLVGVFSSEQHKTEDTSHNIAQIRTFHLNLSWMVFLIIFLDIDVLRDLTMEDQMADCCPLCHMPFDKGKKRRLIDNCGHAKCYSCMFNSDSCRICENSKCRLNKLERIVPRNLIVDYFQTYFGSFHSSYVAAN